MECIDKPRAFTAEAGWKEPACYTKMFWTSSPSGAIPGGGPPSPCTKLEIRQEYLPPVPVPPLQQRNHLL